MLALLAIQAVPKELDAYLKAPNPAYRYALGPTTDGNREIDLTSGGWQGTTWEHKILLRQPRKPAAKGVGILYITGDGPTNGDRLTLNLVAEGTGMPVAMLFKVPNQPLFEGKREDDLIAYSFQKYLETGDATWPLLFPMARVAIKAMDAVQAATKGTANPIKRFVVCGASKRGWTTWMVGASGDKRVAGIAPMVYENLNLQSQMPHQLATWGAYSPMIEDYTRRGLQAALATPRGMALGAMVDPYSYLSRMRMPALLIRGSNDPYWTVDALDQYERALPMRHWTLDVPNAGHDLKGGFMAAESIGAFARSVAGVSKMPTPSWVDAPADATEEFGMFRTDDPRFESVKVWQAESDTLDFRKAEYREILSKRREELKGDLWTTRVGLTRPRNAAIFVEARYREDGRAFSLSSPTRVVRKYP